jgi:tRNA(Ile)-lysidine synthase
MISEATTALDKAFLIKVEEIFLEKKLSNKLPKQIAVAVSGGADSLALTLLLQDFCQKRKIKLQAITIDHKMRKSSSIEALKLNKILTKKKIPHQILAIENKKIPQKNIEASLRERRYQMLHSFCVKNKIEFLFLGHHLGDVAENFLIRLFRGSGLDGLSTMKEFANYELENANCTSNVVLVRPLLDVTKDQLKDFLKAKKIKWFEDETNDDEKFLRNKIRKFFENFEDKNLIQKRIKNASDEIAKVRNLFDEIMLREAKEVLNFVEGSFLIDRKKFQKLEESAALKILALVLMEIGEKPYKPRLEKLKNFYNYLTKDEVIKPRNFYGCMAKKYDARFIIIMRESELKNNSIKNSEDLNRRKLRTILKKIF